MRQITIFGANGKVGSQVVALALARGYKVVAFVHSGHHFSENPHLIIKKGDIYNAQDVTDALKGSQVVISALGSWHTPNKDILASGMKHIIPAMEKQGITRIISLTGSGAWDSTDTISLFQKALHFGFSLVAPKILHDGEEHIRLLRDSNLDWTVVRSPPMTNWGHKGTYRLLNTFPGPFATIQRSDVAHSLIDLVEDNTFNAQSPIIYR